MPLYPQTAAISARCSYCPRQRSCPKYPSKISVLQVQSLQVLKSNEEDRYSFLAKVIDLSLCAKTQRRSKGPLLLCWQECLLSAHPLHPLLFYETE